MTQNGLKWILNKTCKNVTFRCLDNVNNCYIIFFLKASLKGTDIKKKIHGPNTIRGKKILRLFNANFVSFPSP